MSEAIRIRTTPDGGDKYIKIKLEQEFDFLEILSLNINQEDVYKRFSSDYGVIVGRVIINGGFGVPNAKVSVFIPLDDIDKNDVLKKGLYPYENISDKNSDGIRYNLLTQDSDSKNDCFTPIGTFPTKREVLDNEAMLEVYSKYYRFTTTTNHAGDFMLFGVPLGSYTVHLDADISDIGIASQRPYDMISKGAPVSRFDSTTKFSTGTNLDKLIQVKSLNAGVNVQPFWGDTESYEIGITRLDLDLNYDITPAAIFMGSVFGDHGKNSVNKNCRPRKKLGLLKEQITGEGTIRMIRKTLDNKIEEFNVDGSELIDSNGAWAYQIPMNLDYMVTDENGNLILSQDPTKGIPTRTRVRFDIGMTDVGGEGRIRTRARYLVPNNPKTVDEMDYEFGSKTNDKSFRDLHWNKIYTVSNFIGRFQEANPFPASFNITRNATAIKDVDGADGNKTPFPYNKVNTETNPLFTILCAILTVIIFIVKEINDIVIGGINLLLGILNNPKVRIISIKHLFRITLWNPIPYVKCIVIKCPSDTPENYAPGCSGHGMDNNVIFSTSSEDLLACYLIQLSDILGVYQFDFYNDWVNGSLYSFLLKYKKRNKHEKYCDYDCGDNCHDNRMYDTCLPKDTKNSQEISAGFNFNDGLIKKYNNEFYYAATDRTANVKLFATELVNLGSIFECDWQGIPKIQKLLIPTTYKLPPELVEYDNTTKNVIVTGMVYQSVQDGLFFNVDCSGLHSDGRQVLNIRHICEMGVNLDETIYNPDGSILKLPDAVIGVSDIDDNNGKWFRDVFLGLNNSKTPWNTVFNLVLPYSSEFNLSDTPLVYNFVNSVNNGVDYTNFRNYSLYNTISNNTNFGQPDHSYYFYFGTQPGNTGLDKMNKKFFASCIQPQRDDILIESNSTPDLLNNGGGCITFSFLGGTGPFNYTISGLNKPQGDPLNITPITNIIASSNLNTQICSLFAGTYLISATDSVGTIVTDTIIINGPTPLYCYSYVSSMLTHDYSSDGAITIGNTGGGKGILHYVLKNSNGTTVKGPGLATSNLILNGLSSDDIGYSLTVYDESVPPAECTTTGLIISGISVLHLTSTVTNIQCYGTNTGAIDLTILGGVAPYTTTTTGLNYTSSDLNMTGLASGQYTVTIVDSAGSTITPTTITISEENPQMIISKPTNSTDISAQSDPNNYNIPFDITAGVSSGTVNIQYTLDGNIWLDYPLQYSSNNRYVMTISSEKLIALDTISIRFWVNNVIHYDSNGIALPPCYSDEISYTTSEMELPPISLLIKDGVGSNYTPALESIYHNLRQCDPNIATYTFSINQLDAGITSRAPYTIDYRVEDINGTTQTLSHFNGLVTLTGVRNINTANGVVDNNVDFYVKITDSKGVIYPDTGWYNAAIVLPTVAMTKTIITTGPDSSGNYIHTLTVTGGNDPLTLTGIGTIPNGSPYQITNKSLLYVNTVTDANGCSINIIG